MRSGLAGSAAVERRIPTLDQFLDRADIDRAIVEVLLDLGKVRGKEPPIHPDRVPTEGNAPRLGDMSFDEFQCLRASVGKRQRRGSYRLEQSAASVHLDDYRVHLGKCSVVLVNDKIGTFSDDVQIVVGHQRGYLDDHVARRFETGHLQIHPYQHPRRLRECITVPAMELPARPAATVMLLRDTARSIEVFMLRRTRAAAFASGMYVFPGGKVDPADGDGDTSYVIAAIRECYEEAGVLLALDDSGSLIRDGHPALAHRHAVHDGDVDLQNLCKQHDLRPAIDDLVWVSHWITPLDEPARRFDTRFFVAAAPGHQTSKHDDNETIASVWVSPGDALRRQANGELTMMPPTIKNLEFLDLHESTAAVMASARELPRPAPILPKLRRDAAGRIRGVSLPDDDDYDTLA